MENISHKPTRMHKAVATAMVRLSNGKTVLSMNEGGVLKGPLIEASRLAGLLAIKKTSKFIPHGYSFPVAHAAILFSIKNLQVTIRVEVAAISRTGVELDAMHGAAISALTLFQQLQPVDPFVEIGPIKITPLKDEKKVEGRLHINLRCAVVVCSDAISSGLKEDIAGRTIRVKLKDHGIACDAYAIIPDDVGSIQAKAKAFANEGFDLLIFCGGTGLYSSDVTPEAINPLIQRQLPGIMEAARSYGQRRTPFALFSRGVAGFIKSMLVLTLPGSARGAAETMDALFPDIMQVFSVPKPFNEEEE